MKALIILSSIVSFIMYVRIYKIAVPCFGCDDGTKSSWYRCWKGTGKASKACKLQKIANQKFLTAKNSLIKAFLVGSDTLKELSDNLPRRLAQYINNVKKLVMKLKQEIVRRFVKIKEIIIEKAKEIISELKGVVVKSIKVLYDKIVKPIISFVTNYIISPIKILIGKVFELKDQIIESIKVGINQILNLDWDFLNISKFANILTDAIAGLANNIKDFVQFAVNELKDGIFVITSHIYNTVTNYGVEIPLNFLIDGLEDGINVVGGGLNTSIGYFKKGMQVIEDTIENGINNLFIDSINVPLGSIESLFKRMYNWSWSLTTPQIPIINRRFTILPRFRPFGWLGGLNNIRLRHIDLNLISKIPDNPIPKIDIPNVVIPDMTTKQHINNMERILKKENIDLDDYNIFRIHLNKHKNILSAGDSINNLSKSSFPVYLNKYKKKLEDKIFEQIRFNPIYPQKGDIILNVPPDVVLPDLKIPPLPGLEELKRKFEELKRQIYQVVLDLLKPIIKAITNLILLKNIIQQSIIDLVTQYFSSEYMMKVLQMFKSTTSFIISKSKDLILEKIVKPIVKIIGIIKKSIIDFISVIFIKIKAIFTEFSNKIKENITIIIDKLETVAKSLTQDIGYLVLYLTSYIIEFERNLILPKWTVSSVFYLNIVVLIMILFGGPIILLISLIVQSIMLPINVVFEINSIMKYLGTSRMSK